MPVSDRIYNTVCRCKCMHGIFMHIFPLNLPVGRLAKTEDIKVEKLFVNIGKQQQIKFYFTLLVAVEIFRFDSGTLILTVVYLCVVFCIRVRSLDFPVLCFHYHCPCSCHRSHRCHHHQHHHYQFHGKLPSLPKNIQTIRFPL